MNFEAPYWLLVCSATLEVLILGAMYIIIGLVGWGCFTGLIVSLGAPNRRPVDISDMQAAPPENVRQIIAKLKNLGFQRLGEVQVETPMSGSPGRSWVLVSPDGFTRAEAVESYADMVGFITMYEDNAATEVTFPIGETLDIPNFRSHTVSTSVEQAYQYQLQQIADFNKTHPGPRVIKSIKDHLECEILCRKLYVRKKFQRLTVRSLAGGLSLLYCLIVTTLVIVFYTSHDIANPGGLHRTLMLLILLNIPSSAVTQWAIRG